MYRNTYEEGYRDAYAYGPYGENEKATGRCLGCQRLFWRADLIRGICPDCLVAEVAKRQVVVIVEVREND
jgi:hypothetical protein